VATIIDALLVTLGIDSAGIRKGADEAIKAQDDIEVRANESASAQKKRDTEASNALKKKNAEETKISKEREARAKKAAESLQKIRNEALGVAAAFFGISAITGFGERLVQTNADVGRLSKTLDLNVTSLAAWQGAAAKFGATTDDVSNAFRNVNKIQQEINTTGNTTALQPLLRAGVDAKFFNSATSAEEKMRLLSTAFQKLTGQQAAFLGGQAGFSEAFVRMLQAGPAALNKEIELQKKLNPINEQATKDAIDLESSWAHFKTGITGVGNAFLHDLMPAIKSALESLASLLEFATQHLPATEALVTALGAAFAVLSLKSIAGAIASVSEFTGGMGLAATAASKLIGLLGSAGLVTAAGAAGYALGSVLGSALDSLITKMTGTDASLGTFIYDLLHPKEAAKTPAATKSKPSTNKPASPASAIPSGVPSEVAKAAQAAQAKYGIPAEVTIAQWKLESSSGAHMPTGSNNPFGIKATAGQPFVEAETNEFINGQMVRVKQKFAKFDSLEDAFAAHAKLLATGSAYTEARKHLDNPAAFADALTGKYATDPRYGEKLKKLMASQLDPALAKALTPGPQVDKTVMAGASAAAMANQSTTNNNQANQTNSVETHIGSLNINAPNAKTNSDVANAIGDKLGSYSFGSMANTGLA